MVEVVATTDVPPERLTAIRRLCDRAFGGAFSDDDWLHTTGGVHVTVDVDGELVAHAAVVGRVLAAAGRPLRVGYVEGVATAPEWRRCGYATLAMRQLMEQMPARFELGALSTGQHRLYERLGWERWCGPTMVKTAGGLVRTEDDDDGIMVLRFGPSRDVDLAGSLVCEARPGDDW